MVKEKRRTRPNVLKSWWSRPDLIWCRHGPKRRNQSKFLRDSLAHTSSFFLTISVLRKNQGKVPWTREVNVLLNEALLFTRFLLNSHQDILMKITSSRFEIQKSVVFRDLSRSPKPFSVCKSCFFRLFLTVFLGVEFYVLQKYEIGFTSACMIFWHPRAELLRFFRYIIMRISYF